MVYKEWRTWCGTLLLAGCLFRCVSSMLTREKSVAGSRGGNCPLAVCPVGFVARAGIPAPPAEGAGEELLENRCCLPSGHECDPEWLLNFSGSAASWPRMRGLQHLHVGTSAVVKNVLPLQGEIDLRISLVSVRGRGTVAIDDSGRMQLSKGATVHLRLSFLEGPNHETFVPDHPFYLGLEAMDGMDGETALVEPASDARYAAESSSVSFLLNEATRQSGMLRLQSSSSQDMDWFPRVTLRFDGHAEEISVSLQAAAHAGHSAGLVALKLTGASAVACNPARQAAGPPTDEVSDDENESVPQAAGTPTDEASDDANGSVPQESLSIAAKLERFLAGIASDVVGSEPDDLSTQTSAETDTHTLVDIASDAAGSESDDLSTQSQLACRLQAVLKFWPRGVAYSNLAGMGPDLRWPEAIVFTDVFPYSGHIVDLQVTTVAENFSGRPLPLSRMVGGFGLIGVSGNSQVSLAFSFTDRGSGEPWAPTLPYYITFLAMPRMMDMSHADHVLEAEAAQRTSPCVSVLQAVNVPDTASDDGCVPVGSALIDFADLAKNLAEPRSMPKLEEGVAVFLVPPNSSTLNVTLKILNGDVDHEFLFAGATNHSCATPASCRTLSCPEGFKPKWDNSLMCAGPECGEDDVEICCEARVWEQCSPARSFSVGLGATLRRNLGNAGPDDGEEGMVFTDVFPQSDQVIDLHVSALTEYTPLNPDAAGREGNFMTIGLQCGTSVDLAMRFFSRVTKQEMVPPPFLLAAIDLKPEEEFDCAQSVEAEGLPIYVPSSAMNMSEDDLTLGQDFSFEEEPSHPAALSKSQELRTVVFQVQERSQITLKLRTTPGSGSRTFRFAGPSSAACGQRALCSHMDCPLGTVPRQRSQDLTCRGAECGREDVNTCCQPIHRRACEPRQSIHIGPQVDTPVIYRDLAMHFPGVMSEPGSGNIIDLAVSSPLGIMAGGVDFGWGIVKVQLQPGKPVDVNFHFFNRIHNEDLKEFYFTLHDVGPDAPQLDGAQVLTTMEGISSVHLAPNSQLVINPSNQQPGLLRYFSVHSKGKDGGPYGHPMHPSNRSRPRMVTVLVPKESASFNVSLLLMPGSVAAPDALVPHQADQPVNWTLYFGGPSKLICPQVAMCNSLICPDGMRHKALAHKIGCADGTCTDEDVFSCCESEVAAECEDSTILDLSDAEVVHSNLGGQGPNFEDPEMLLLRNVFPHASKPVDLEITATTEYTADDASWNGIWRHMGMINVAPASTAELNFRFVDPETGNTKELEQNIMLSWFHLYSDDSGAAMQVTMPTFLLYELHHDSHVRLNGISFSSSSPVPPGVGSTGPVDPLALSYEEKRSTVSLLLPSGNGEFSVKLSVGEGSNASRNFIFSGSSSISCPSRALCSTFRCPAGLEPKESVDHTTCAGPTCENVDVTVCCDVPEQAQFLAKPAANITLWVAEDET